tara:strand:- start:1724 stop:2602 length:879 start_codon:yes stop_codon:yes gene_type:complete
MEKKFIDPNIKFKSVTIEQNIQFFKIRNKEYPLPTEIEISESGTCNRKCSFCPRSDPNFVDRKIFISNKLYSKLCNELQELSYKGTIRFSGFVEPLLDKNIFNLIQNTRSMLNSVNIELVTNGDVLNKKRLIKLFDSGLNKILISAYDSKEDAEIFQKMCEDIGLENNQFIVRHRYLGPEDDFGITLSNRAGQMENAEFKIESLSKSLSKPCFIPSYTFFLDYQGDVLICPHDWGKKIVLGNLNNSKLTDIWFSKRAISIRKMLNKSQRNFTPCNLCDVDGTLMGEKNSTYF